MNPGSRSGRGKHLWKTLECGLKQAGVDYTSVFTERVGHATELARTAESDVVVAVGGDGTINEVLDGIIKSENVNLKMGVLYSGTSPDFCKFQRIPIRPEEAVAALLSGHTHRVDVARITYHDASGTEQIAHFGCSCNIGMGASVARFANKWRRYLGDVCGTGTGLVYTIARNLRVDVDMEIDGHAVHLPEVNNLTIAKNPHVASGLKLQLDLHTDDGNLSIVGVHAKGRAGILGLLPKFYSGAVTTDPDTFLTQCKSVTITTNERQEIEFDGDPRGFLPAKIEILPQALSLIGGTNE